MWGLAAPVIRLGGRILECAEYTNPLLGGRYYWALVSLIAAQIDVVWEPELADRPPTPGGWLDSEFWLCGRILEPSESWLRNAISSILDRIT